MNLIKWNPLAPGKTSLDNAVSDFFNSSINDIFKSDFTWSQPSVNIIEEDETYQIEVAAPGLEKKDFNVEVKEGHLIISVEKAKKDEKKEEDDNYTRREFNYQSFKRSFHLPDTIDSESIDGNYRNGVLTISLPKKEEAKPKDPVTIDIK